MTLDVAGLTVTANDRVAVYASDDDTFTTVAGGNSLIGWGSRFESAGVGVVEFDAMTVKAALA